MARSHVSLRFLAVTALLAVVPLSALWSWKRGGPLRHEATVLVPRGMTVDQMADLLAREGIIRNERLFKAWARLRRLQLIRGEYTFDPRASASDVANKLRRGDIHFTAVVLTPSMHAWSVEKRLRSFIPEEVFWKLWRSPRLASAAGFPQAESLEGLLAPATYKLHHAMEPEEILLMMVEAFHHHVAPELEGGRLAPYPTLILASLVEKETSVPAERAKVAGVYAKRLRMGMRLQCDPTSLYARWLTGDLRFTAPGPEDTHRPHPFNTYTHAGLPPTPIAIPSREAIEAAKAPEVDGDLFFVATGKGGHSFAPNLQEHNRNVYQLRKTLKARNTGAKRP